MEQRQLTLRLPHDSHRTLKMIAAATGKTMTELIIRWIEETKKTIFGKKGAHAQKGNGPIVRKLTASDVDQILKEGSPLAREFSDEEIERWSRYELEGRR